MRRIKVKAHELLDVDVDLISLVKRPSTRIPFPIIKSQDAKGGHSMFDLAQVFRAKSEAQAPVVTSVIVKGEASPGMLELLAKQGFSVEKAETENGITVYPQDVAYDGEVSVVKISDTLALTVPVIKAADGSFAEMCAARGFYPALNIAVDLLNCELYKAVEKADSPSVAATKVAAVVSDFGTFMSTLVGALPGQVFKTEDAVTNGDEEPGSNEPEAASEEATSEDAPAGPTIEQQASDVEQPPVDTGEHASDAPAHESETNPIRDAAAAAENPTDEPPPAVVEADDPTNTQVASPVEGQPTITHVAKDEVAEIVAAALGAALSPITEALTGLTGRIDGIEQGVQKAEEKLGTTVLSGVFDAHRAERSVTVAEKADNDGGLIDTAFAHKRGRK